MSDRPGILRLGLDRWMSPTSFRLALITTPLYLSVGVVSLYQLGVGYLVAYLALGALWWLESSLTVCRRCQHFDTWHCGGQAKIVARLFQRRRDRIGRGRLFAHLLFDTLMLLGPLVSGALVFGVAAAVPCALWVVFSAVSAMPRGGFSYLK